MATSDRYRVAIVGFGNTAQWSHVPALARLRDQYEIVAVVDPSPENRRLASEQLELSANDIFSDVAALEDRTDVDVIDICTPPLFRKAIVAGAMRRGQHVVCEKPIATTPREAAEIERLAEAGTGILAMVHNYLYLPQYAALWDPLRDGLIGDVEFVNINALGYRDIPGTASYKPAWRRDPSIGGGGLLMDLIHYVYLAEHLMGGPIERVTASMRVRDPSGTVEDLVSCRFDSANTSAVVNLGWGHGPGGIFVSGSQGRAVVRYEDADSQAPVEEVFIVNDSGRRQLTLGDHTSGHEGVFRDLARAIAEGGDAQAPATVGARILEAVIAAYASATMGRSVDLPLETTDPVYQLGVAGLKQLPIDGRSWVARCGLFGIGGHHDAEPDEITHDAKPEVVA